MRLALKPLIFCLLTGPGLALGQDTSGRETPGDQAEALIKLLASRGRSVPKRELLERLLQNREANLPGVRKAARDGDRETRLMALRLLAEMKDPEAARIAGESLASKEVAIRRRAGSVLMLLEDDTQVAKVLARLPVERDSGALKSLIAAAGSSGHAATADAIRPYLRDANQSVRVNTAIALARLGSMEALGTVLEALQGVDMQARREAAYGLGFFSGKRQKAQAAAQAIIDNPAGTWKAEAGISLLRLELAASAEKLELLSNASTLRQPRVQAWSIQAIARMGGKDAAAWLKQRAALNDPLGRFAGLQLLMKGEGSHAKK
jgi:HEAT repeat protein